MKHSDAKFENKHVKYNQMIRIRTGAKKDKNHFPYTKIDEVYRKFKDKCIDDHK